MKAIDQSKTIIIHRCVKLLLIIILMILIIIPAEIAIAAPIAKSPTKHVSHIKKGKIHLKKLPAKLKKKSKPMKHKSKQAKIVKHKTKKQNPTKHKASKPKSKLKVKHKIKKQNPIKHKISKPNVKHKIKKQKSLKHHHKSLKTKPAKFIYTSPPPNKDADKIVEEAFAQLGKPYHYAAAGPTAFDCSGLISFCYAKAGIILPHNAAEQKKISRPVAYKDLQPGDLIFFNGTKHVGMYIGQNKFIQAPHTGAVVRISTLAKGKHSFSACRPHEPKTNCHYT